MYILIWKHWCVYSHVCTDMCVYTVALYTAMSHLTCFILTCVLSLPGCVGHYQAQTRHLYEQLWSYYFNNRWKISHKNLMNLEEYVRRTKFTFVVISSPAQSLALILRTRVHLVPAKGALSLFFSRDFEMVDKLDAMEDMVTLHLTRGSIVHFFLLISCHNDQRVNTSIFGGFSKKCFFLPPPPKQCKHMWKLPSSIEFLIDRSLSPPPLVFFAVTQFNCGCCCQHNQQ